MKKSRRSVCNLLMAYLLAGVVAGCGGKTYEYRPSAGEMKEGPGVFSGKDGEFKVYDSKDRETIPADTGMRPMKSARVDGGEPQANPEETKEYREFLEWKQREEDSEEYREFKEWQEWKAFQEWRKSRE